MSSELVDALLLGVLQGLTEFLPVSSSGHLMALKTLRHSPLAGDLTLDVLLHAATLAAVLVVFRADFLRLGRGIFHGGEGRRWIGLVLVGAVPAGIAGLLLKDHLGGLAASHPVLLPVCWLVTAAALLSIRHREREPGGAPMDLRAALWIGCWQALAILPGISRSGITIIAALWLRRRRDEAATFSFLCATPLIAGAALLTVLDLSAAGSRPALSPLVITVGSLVAFATGWLALLILLGMLRRGALHRWAYYLIPVAIAYTCWLTLM